jgi:hypothetical protein
MSLMPAVFDVVFIGPRIVVCAARSMLRPL